MKTVILCAGLGTRLKHFSDGIPKCMIEISGKPLIKYTLESLSLAGIKDIYINLHYNPERIKNYLGDGAKFNVNITYSFEEKLLGSAGALNNFKKFLNEDFIVIYGDTYREMDFADMMDTFHKSDSLGLIGLHRPENPFDSGVVLINNKFKIQEFIEKPIKNEILNIKNYYSNAGVYIFKKEIFNYIPECVFSDFGTDIFPELIKEKQIYGYLIKDTVIDIGVPERLEKLYEYLSEKNQRISIY